MYEKQSWDDKFSKIFYHLLSYLNNKPNVNEVDNVVTYLVQISKPKQVNGRDIGDFDRLEQILQIEQTAINADIDQVIESQDQNLLYDLFMRFYKQSEAKIANKLGKHQEILRKFLKEKERKLRLKEKLCKKNRKIKTKQQRL